MEFHSGYYGPMDRGFMEKMDALEAPMAAPEQITQMSPHDIGTSANPFQHPLQSLQARIREGGKKVELEFFGMGKGNKERFTPESIGSAERRDIRELAKINEVETTVHATPAFSGVAGLTRNGFDEQQREQNLKELKKAIDFSAEATTGGAVVVHTGEWDRPINMNYGKEGFKAYPEEHNKAPIMVVDEETGQIQGIRRDYTVYEPVFVTAKDQGLTQDADGRALKPDDWVDINNKYIPRNDTQRLFDRVPKWLADQTKFEVKKVAFTDFEQRAAELEKETGEKIAPEVLFYKTQLQNQALQARGNSLYHAQQYEEYKFTRDKIAEALSFYKKLDERLSEEEKRKLLTDRYPNVGPKMASYIVPDKESVTNYLEREKKEMEDRMRHVHEASASADVQAKEVEERMNRIRTIEEYGIEKSADTLARAGILAYTKTKEHAADLKNPIYISPENWDPQQYASHPDEMIKLVTKSREHMADMLVKHHHVDPEMAMKQASQHIRATIDSGHMNLWRQHFERKPGEGEESFDKRYRKWYVGQVQKLAKSGVVGHIHLTDNFGYDDEHLTLGHGNTPVKELIKAMEEAGIKDMIVEPGSFNPQTALPEAWQFLGSPVYAIGHPTMQRGWGSFHQQSSGYGAPPFYIVGAYAPSNDFRLWSEVPFE
ncbi:MAG: hypothetical protein ABIA93_03605 [Candidatus Woesearchaeota archaeon]